MRCQSLFFSIIPLLALLPALFVSQLASANDDLASQVEGLFTAWDQADVPGCSVGIVRDGKLVHARGYGSANLNHEVLNTPKTVFPMASLSKSVTCACLALLMDQGKISPEDEVRQYLPELHAHETPIRLRHMIRCHSGIWAQFHILPLAGWGNVPIHAPYSKEDLFTLLAGQRRLPFEPGSRFQYGSGEYFLLAMVVERVTGQTLAEFARENLFNPLGMSRTFYMDDPSLVVPNLAVGHYQDKQGNWHPWNNHGYLSGGGGMYSCVEDLQRWANQFNGHAFSRGQYVDTFFSEGTLLENRFVLDLDAYRRKVHEHPDNAPAGMYRGLRRLMFTGGFWGSSVAMAHFPSEKFTAICLANNDEISPWRKCHEIVDLYLAEKLAPLPATEDIRDLPVISLPESELVSKVGDYRMEQGITQTWRIVFRDGRLHVVDRMRDAYPLEPVSPSRFRPAGESPFYDSAEFAFTPETAETPSSFTLRTFEWQVREVLRFEHVELAQPSSEELAEYAGDYFSDEINSAYRFRAREGGLEVRLHGRRWERLEPTIRDEFIAAEKHPHDNRIFKFMRDDAGKVWAVGIDFWRIHGLRFDKQAPEQGRR